MRRLVIAMLVSLIGGLTGAWARQQAYTYGFGNSSCAAVMQLNQNLLIEDWALGYISGLNKLNKHRHDVGSHTDAKEVWGEVMLECSNNPSENFGEAISKVYDKMDAKGR